MQAYKFETTLTQHGTLMLNNLPLKAGQFVEVIILTRSALPPSLKRYTLRGLPITYLDPFEPVAENDWESLQ